MISISSVTRACRASWPYIRHAVCLVSILYLTAFTTVAIFVPYQYGWPQAWSFDLPCATITIASAMPVTFEPGEPRPHDLDKQVIHSSGWGVIWSGEFLRSEPSDVPGLLRLPSCVERAFFFTDHSPHPTFFIISLQDLATQGAFLSLLLSVLLLIAATAAWTPAFSTAKDVFTHWLDEYDAAKHLRDRCGAVTACCAMLVLPVPVFVMAVFIVSANTVLMRHRA